MSYKNNVIKIDLCLIHYIYFRNRKVENKKKQENEIEIEFEFENSNLMKIL